MKTSIFIFEFFQRMYFILFGKNVCKVEELIVLHHFYQERRIYCYKCRKRTSFTRRDLNKNIGVESHCSECTAVWFEWQNRAVERELEKWSEYNSEKYSQKPYINFTL